MQQRHPQDLTPAHIIIGKAPGLIHTIDQHHQRGQHPGNNEKAHEKAAGEVEMKDHAAAPLPRSRRLIQRGCAACQSIASVSTAPMSEGR